MVVYSGSASALVKRKHVSRANYEGDESVRSKAVVRFLNRAARYNDDLELIAVFGLAVERNTLTPESGTPLFEHIDAGLHPRLTKAKPSDHNRQLVYGHLRKTVYASYIKDLYEDFVDYLGDIVSSAARKGFDPNVLRGEYKVQLSAADLLEAGSWDTTLALMVEALHHRLAAMGTVKIIEFLDKRLGLELDQGVIDAAMSYIDLRHLLVHCDGIADEGFCSRNPALCTYPNDSVRLDDSVVTDAYAAIVALVEHIDERAVATGILASEDLN